MHGLGEPTQYLFSDKKEADKFVNFKNTIGNGYYFVQEQKVYESVNEYKEVGFDDYVRSLQNKAFHLHDDQIYYINLLSEQNLNYRSVPITAKEAEEYLETLRDTTKFWIQKMDDEFSITRTSRARLKEIVDENQSDIQKVIDEIDKANEDYIKTKKYREENSTELPF